MLAVVQGHERCGRRRRRRRRLASLSPAPPNCETRSVLNVVRVYRRAERGDNFSFSSRCVSPTLPPSLSIRNFFCFFCVQTLQCVFFSGVTHNLKATKNSDSDSDDVTMICHRTAPHRTARTASARCTAPI